MGFTSQTNLPRSVPETRESLITIIRPHLANKKREMMFNAVDRSENPEEFTNLTDGYNRWDVENQLRIATIIKEIAGWAAERTNTPINIREVQIIRSGTDRAWSEDSIPLSNREFWESNVLTITNPRLAQVYRIRKVIDETSTDSFRVIVMFSETDLQDDYIEDFGVDPSRYSETQREKVQKRAEQLYMVSLNDESAIERAVEKAIGATCDS
jgi:hypothetical protein